LRWRKTGDEELEELTKLQRELLDAGAKLVKPGGVLVYSTCSIEYKENQGVALAFYQRNKRWFELSDARLRAPSNDLVDESGFFYQCLPHKTQTDGAFATRFVKREKKEVRAAPERASGICERKVVVYSESAE
jgi:16S rRNA (cytosine967-C5)-methyltransferase